MRVTSVVAAAFALLLGCTGTPGGDDDEDPGSSSVDPFASPPDRGAGLTDVSADLDAVLEHGALATACDDYARAPGDRRLRLLCGKAMFFDESFGTPGVPKPIVTWLVDNFPDQVGPGFAQFGMVADPRSTGSGAALPLGLPPGPLLGSVETLSFGCASCHFAQLPDGRYAVGAPNHRYAYGPMTLVMTLLPALSIPGADPAAHDPAALALVQPFRARMDANPAIGTALITALLPLITGGGGTLPAFDAQNEHWYAQWSPGTMDFFIQPLPFDDGVHTISKISSLWSFADEAELSAAGAPSMMLGWTGGTSSIHNFLAGFVDLGGGPIAEWPRERLAPLHDYVMSLRAPEPPAIAPAATRGREVWLDAGCQDCHGGPRGMGTQVYTFDEIGTDDAMRWWADGPDHDGAPYGDLRFQPGDTITHGLKSPRLVGLWAMQRFLHNGSLESLEQLLCVEPRGGITEAAFADGGHTYGCDLPEADRRALVDYLRSH